jgi:hypothetical protein
VKILFVGAHPPLPLDNGGRLRTFHLLDELAQRAAVALVALDREPASGMRPCPAEAIEMALPALSAVHVVAPPQARKRVRQLTSLATRRSYTEALYRTPALVSAATTPSTSAPRPPTQYPSTPSWRTRASHRTPAPVAAPGAGQTAGCRRGRPGASGLELEVRMDCTGSRAGLPVAPRGAFY